MPEKAETGTDWAGLSFGIELKSCQTGFSNVNKQKMSTKKDQNPS